MRVLWICIVCALLAGCASAGPQLRGPTEVERAQIDRALAPLVTASALCRGQDRCPIGVGVIQLRRIDMAVGPHPPNMFGITITTGALKNLEPSELQAALAHELGHVQLGHFESRAERRQGESPGLAKASDDGEDALRRNRAYDREEELAADRYAVKLLDRLPGSPGRGCADMLLLLERLDLEMTVPAWSNWLSTHPTPTARLQALRTECGEKP
jgi:Zn-dependent protease with chaperone function